MRRSSRIAAVLLVVVPGLALPGGAREIPELDLRRVDPAVREQLTARRAELDAMLAREPSPPGLAKALGDMGRLYLAYDYLLASVACLEEALERDPGHFEHAYLLGYAYDRLGKPDAAIAAFEKSVELAPENPVALLRLANHLLAQRRAGEARPLFERALAADGACVGALYGLGEIARQARDDEGAASLFRKALARAPDSAQVRYSLGQALRRLGKVDEAAEHLAKADWRQISLGGWLGCADPLVGELAEITTGAPAHLLRGGLATFRGLPEMELEEYRLAVAADPESARARLFLGMALLRQNDVDGAAEQYREAVRLAPTIASYRHDYGLVLEKLGDGAAAEEQFRAAADIDPRFKEARLKLAEISVKQGKADQVLRHSQAVLEVDPLHRRARMLLSMALLQLGRRPEAAAELGRLMDDHPPEDLSERLQLATLLATLGDLARAREHFAAVRDLAADTTVRATALTRLGQVAMATGDRDGAVESLRAALALVPGFPEARAVLAQLEQSASCGTHGGGLPAETLPPPPLMDGIGTSKMPITTGSELAQKYFDQGVNLLHDYWDFEAYRAFREASRLDPGAAMPYWGLYMSLAYNQAEHGAERREALDKAAALVGAASDREQRYVRAITRLNAAGPGRAGQEAFIAEMEALIAAYPDDLEAELFLIKFLVNDAAGSFLDPERGVGSGFDRARERLRPLLESHPDSLAVHHYWIHVHEFGPEPEAALASARKLPTLAPKSGHILHMPGHIYFQLGDYQKAYEAFQASLRFDREYMAASGVEPVDNWNYVHNLDYLVANCAEDGRYREGRKWAEVLHELAVPLERSESVGLGFVVYGGRSAPARLHLRYGRWREAAESLSKTLEATRFPSRHAADYLRGLLLYARGMAALERGDAAGAGQRLQEVLGLAMGLTQQTAELGSDWYFEVARRILVISAMELSGSLLSSQGQHDAALQNLARAVQAEQGLGYGEPPHYTRPVQESVGLAYLRAGKAAEALAAYRRALDQRPGSGHAWYGIARAHDLAGDVAETREAYRRFLEVWKHADPDLPEIEKAKRWLAEHP